jgi:TM2 domain-containing membrane protein YozV
MHTLLLAIYQPTSHLLTTTVLAWLWVSVCIALFPFLGYFLNFSASLTAGADHMTVLANETEEKSIGKLLEKSCFLDAERRTFFSHSFRFYLGNWGQGIMFGIVVFILCHEEIDARNKS